MPKRHRGRSSDREHRRSPSDGRHKSRRKSSSRKSSSRHSSSRKSSSRHSRSRSRRRRHSSDRRHSSKDRKKRRRSRERSRRRSDRKEERPRTQSEHADGQHQPHHPEGEHPNGHQSKHPDGRHQPPDRPVDPPAQSIQPSNSNGTTQPAAATSSRPDPDPAPASQSPLKKPPSLKQKTVYTTLATSKKPSSGSLAFSTSGVSLKKGKKKKLNMNRKLVVKPAPPLASAPLPTKPKSTPDQSKPTPDQSKPSSDQSKPSSDQSMSTSDKPKSKPMENWNAGPRNALPTFAPAAPEAGAESTSASSFEFVSSMNEQNARRSAGEASDMLDSFMSDIEKTGKVAKQAQLESVPFEKRAVAVKSITLDDILAGNFEDEDNADQVDDMEEGDDEEVRKEFMAAIRKQRDDELKEQKLAEEERQKAEEAAAKLLEQNRKPDLVSMDKDDDDYEGFMEGANEPSALERLKEKMNKKDLKAVDHSKVVYAPFRKQFYIEAPEIAEMSADEVASIRKDLEISTGGKKIPKPIDTWVQAGLSARMLAVLKHQEWDKPFAIQRQVLPVIMGGRDVIGVAKTGSGKTLAFLIPMFRHIADQPPVREGEGPIGLVMAPARELAVQIYAQVKKFTKALNLRAIVAYGGAPIKGQIGALKGGAEVCVCTPGRLIELLCVNSGRILNLARVTYVVMDEADRMFDLGFEPQIMRIINNIRPDRQTVLFSATFPVQVERLARNVLRKNAVEIVVGGRTKASGDIKQFVEVREESQKFDRLLQLLGRWYEKGNILVFVDTQQRCDQLFQDLMRSGYTCLSLHGGKEQLDRDYTIKEFKDKIRTLMIATSVAGRGLDVPDLVLVINYNCPNHLEDYIHRIGRTGRAGRKGTAYTFITPSEDKFAPDLVKALTGAKQKVPDPLQKLNDGFMEQLKSGQVKFRSSGYRGSGFTFDQNEKSGEQAHMEMMRKQYEISAGLRGEDDDDNDARDAPGGEAVPAGPSNAQTADVVDANGKPNSRLKSILSKLNHKISNNDAITIAPSKTAATDKNHNYSAEVDINDYPQQARWKINQKETISHISAYSNCAITSRGEYIPPGRAVNEGQRKLHLFVEGDSVYNVKRCIREIERILEETTSNINFDKEMSRGKYKVLS